MLDYKPEMIEDLLQQYHTRALKAINQPAIPNHWWVLGRLQGLQDDFNRELTHHIIELEHKERR